MSEIKVGAHTIYDGEWGTMHEGVLIKVKINPALSHKEHALEAAKLTRFLRELKVELISAVPIAEPVEKNPSCNCVQGSSLYCMIHNPWGPGGKK